MRVGTSWVDKPVIDSPFVIVGFQLKTSVSIWLLTSNSNALLQGQAGFANGVYMVCIV